MIHSNIAVEANNLSKAYQIWRDPKARLKSPILRLVATTLLKFKLLGINRVGEFLQSKADQYSKNFFALKKVSFQVKKGEALGIVGLNGSGKSTLLQILTGVLNPTSGSVQTSGRIAALLELGAGFNGEFTGRENVYLNGAILGIPSKEMDLKFDKIAEFAEIGDFIDQPVKTYSSGMSVRLAFAVLTQIDPDILIIDEALSVGDAYFQHKSAKVIRTFCEQGKTLLFVAHDPNAVKSLCTRAILLDHGTVIREGKAEDILDYYNAIVAKKEKDNEIRQIENAAGRTLTRSGNQEAEITKIEFFNGNGEPCRAFAIGDSSILRVSIKFNKSIQDPTFGILIKDRLGVDVFGTNTHYNMKDSFHVTANQEATAEAHLKLALGPGSYSITIAIHSGFDHTDENFDWIDNAIVFNVLSDSKKYFIGTAALPCEIFWSSNEPDPHS